MTMSETKVRYSSPHNKIGDGAKYSRQEDDDFDYIEQQHDFVLYEETHNFIEWSKWDKLLREQSRDSDDEPLPQMILITPTSSREWKEAEVPRHLPKDARHYSQHDSMPRDVAHDSGQYSCGEIRATVSESGHHSNRHTHTSHRHSHREHGHHQGSKDELDDSHLRDAILQPEPSQQLFAASDGGHPTRHSPDLETTSATLSRLNLFVERHDSSPQRAMTDGGRYNDSPPSPPPRASRWTDFEYETGSYHLSNRSVHHLDDDIHEANEKPSLEKLGFPSRPAVSLPTTLQSQSPVISSPLRGTQSDGILVEEHGKNKRWSPKRLLCGGPPHPDRLGAFPSSSTAFLPPPPEFSKIKRSYNSGSVHTAPDTYYVPLESKKHSHLDELQAVRRRRHHHHLHSQRHKEFKRQMKTLLEDEYSPYYVKRGPPSLLSHFTGTNEDATKPVLSSTAAASAWKSPSRRKRQWFERSDSKRGKMVSTKPRSMEMVFFPTIDENKEQSFDMSTIKEESDSDDEEEEATAASLDESSVVADHGKD